MTAREERPYEKCSTTRVAYQCDCHDRLPVAIAEIERLRGLLRETTKGLPCWCSMLPGGSRPCLKHLVERQLREEVADGDA